MHLAWTNKVREHLFTPLHGRLYLRKMNLQTHKWRSWGLKVPNEVSRDTTIDLKASWHLPIPRCHLKPLFNVFPWSSEFHNEYAVLPRQCRHKLTSKAPNLTRASTYADNALNCRGQPKIVTMFITVLLGVGPKQRLPEFWFSAILHFRKFTCCSTCWEV
jgi:hypothetical protein